VSARAPVRAPEAPPADEAQLAGGARIERRPLSRRRRVVRALAPKNRLRQLALLVALLGVWEIVGRRSANFTFAPPSSVVPAAREMLSSGELQDAAGDSAVALVLGYLAAVVAGTAVGYAMGWWRAVGSTVSPFVSAFYVVPVVTLVPLIIAWMGLGLGPRVVVIFLFAIFEITLNAYGGVRNIDPVIVDVARSFGARRREMVRKVLIPASLPFVFTGLRIGASRAVKGMVLAEMLFAVTGLGGLIIKYAGLFRMDKVLVVIVTIALIGIALSGLVQALERYLLRWRDAAAGARA
jgi:ABC-type nitrate/sulfonate/bicarbonate transport system permease component